MTYKCVIVDDEPLALEVLQSYIEKIDTIELVASCSNAIEAFQVVQQQPIDLLFLDIQMPKLTGIDFLKSIKNPPKVIFTTAYRDYAIEGYELDILDYLLKPFSFERFLKAMSKFYQAQSPVSHTPEVNGDSNINTDYIYLKSEKKMVKVSLCEILFIESLKDYIKVGTPEKDVISYQKISYMEEHLPEKMFLRIHRSYMVAIDKIDAYSATQVEIRGTKIPIGRNYKAQVLKVLGERVI